jgi:hypothetical protein
MFWCWQFTILHPIYISPHFKWHIIKPQIAIHVFIFSIALLPRECTPSTDQRNASYVQPLLTYNSLNIKFINCYVDGRIIWKSILKKYGMMLWNQNEV